MGCEGKAPQVGLWYTIYVAENLLADKNFGLSLRKA